MIDGRLSLSKCSVPGVDLDPYSGTSQAYSTSPRRACTDAARLLLCVILIRSFGLSQSTTRAIATGLRGRADCQGVRVACRLLVDRDAWIKGSQYDS